jgi:hypothetical protein
MGPRLACVIFGHDDLVRRAAGRMYLECAQCGRMTRGWTMGEESGPAGHAGDTIRDPGSASRAWRFAIRRVISDW